MIFRGLYIAIINDCYKTFGLLNVLSFSIIVVQVFLFQLLDNMFSICRIAVFTTAACWAAVVKESKSLLA